MTVRKSLLFWQPCITVIDRPAAPWDNPRPPSELILRGGAIKAGVKYWNVHSSHFPVIPLHRVLSIW